MFISSEQLEKIQLKVSGKMWLKVIIKNLGFTLCLKDKFIEKAQGGEGKGSQIDLFGVKDTHTEKHP